VLDDAESLFRMRLGRTPLRAAIFGLLLLGLAALMVWLWVANPSEDDEPMPLVELANPTTLDRFLGRHQHAIPAPPEEIPVLLDWLRSKASNAAGPPGF
jgi:hypothetical protein